MHNKKTTAFLIMVTYLFSLFSPLSAYAADGAAAAQAAANALSISGQGTPGGISLTPDSGTTGMGNDADTGNGNTDGTSAFPSIGDEATTEPDVTIVKEKLDEDKVATTTAIDATTAAQSPRLDPREVKGSNMYNNLRGRLLRFGADFFAKGRTNTLAYAPVGSNYIVAPGDEVKLNIWGYSEIRATLIVDRDGTLTLPQAGPVTVAGLTFSQMQKVIENAYKKIITDFEINITMGKLHTITVYVTGHAATPGAYAVSSMATLVDVLSQAGGPALSGTMRAIEIKRNNKKIASFDLYKLLLQGDRKGDVRLSDGDIIFIPTVGSLVTVAGNVKRPAIYELAQKEGKLADVLALSGGITAGAYKGRIQLARVLNNTVRTAFESDLNLPEAKVQKLQDGDLLKIFAVSGGSINVRIEGAVIQPGVFAIEPDVTLLSDIIKRAGGLMYTASNEAELTRVVVSEKGPVTSRSMVNLKDVMNGSSNIKLQRDDYLFVRTVPDWNIYRSATVSGRVLYPGNYTVNRGERLSSLIERSGGYAQGAFARGAVFIRESIRADQQKNINDMVEKMEREVMASANQAVSTAVKQADVSFAQASMTQKEKYIDTLKNLKASGRLVVSLPEDYRLIKGSPYDIELQEGDKLHIPERPGTIQVIGSVMTPSAFVFRPGQPFNEYIKMAGGYASLANPKRTYILKADGSTLRAFAGNKPRIIEEGDFIVVPEKILFTPSLRKATDIMDIIYKMVVGIAAIDYVFK